MYRVDINFCRKAKGLKVPTGQTGMGNPWSLFEDQALVVVVHDMGPNWELVSDAINSTLQFKCIYRKPQECKERHKVLMDRSGDGADSADDSGSSQPYPSTLPGIPKGSASKLFQRLQGPMEEDTIKSHFEKIILIGQQLHYRKKQYDNQDLKHIAAVHSSHLLALSQVIPNNVNGGTLTPLDFYDVATSGQEGLAHGYQGPPTSGLTLPNQSTIPSIHPSSGLNSPLQGLQGSPGMGIGNSLPSPSSQFNSPRYAASRSASLPVEEQQRLQQYNHMLPARNVPPSSLPSSRAFPGNDRGVRLHPGGGLMAGMNRSVPMPGTGLQGINSSSMLNSGSMLASNLGGMSNNMNLHPGAAPGQGNSMFRSRDALHMVRPGQNSEHQRQMMLPEMQMQGAQPNSPGVPPFGVLSSGFPNQPSSPSVQTYPGHHQQQHSVSQQHSHLLSSHHPHIPGSNNSPTPEQHALLRIARDRHNQKLMQRQQQQQLQGSGALMTHVQPSSHPSSLPNNSQVQAQASSQSVSSTSMTSTHVKQPVPHGLGRNAQGGASGMTNQVAKQRRQAQQLQQSGRQHPQQRQQSQPQQQAKLSKGMGRAGMLMHQNLPVDPSHLNGLSANNPGAQVAEKGEKSGNSMQGQSLYSVSAPTSLQTSKPPASSQTPSHSQPQKPYANSVSTTSKQVPQMHSLIDANNNGQISGSQASSSAMSIVNSEQPQPCVKLVNQSHSGLQRSTQQSHQVNSDSLTKSQANHAPVTAPASVDSTNAMLISSSPSTTPRKVQDSQCDSSMPSSSAPSGFTGCPVTSSSGNGKEPSPSVSQGLVQRQSSSNMIPQGHGGGAQWQQQQLQLQQPPPLQPIKQPQQQLEQSLELPQQHPQSQVPVGKGNMFSRTANSRSE